MIGSQASQIFREHALIGYLQSSLVAGDQDDRLFAGFPYFPGTHNDRLFVVFPGFPGTHDDRLFAVSPGFQGTHGNRLCAVLLSFGEHTMVVYL